MSETTVRRDDDERCKRCGLGAEPGTWYCGRCWYIVDQLREATGGVFDSDGNWDPSARYVR